MLRDFTRIDHWVVAETVRTFKRCNSTLWSMGGSEGFPASVKDKDNHTACFEGGQVFQVHHISVEHKFQPCFTDFPSSVYQAE